MKQVHLTSHPILPWNLEYSFHFRTQGVLVFCTSQHCGVLQVEDSPPFTLTSALHQARGGPCPGLLEQPWGTAQPVVPRLTHCCQVLQIHPTGEKQGSLNEGH